MTDRDEGRERDFLDRIGDRWPVLRTPIAVQRRYDAVGGNFLAAAVTFQMFLSLLPLMLVGVAVTGFVANADVDFAGRIVRQLGLEGQSADTLRKAVESAAETRRATSVVGLLGLLWVGLGLVAALRNAFNRVWGVEDRGIKGRIFDLVWLAGAGVGFAATVAVTSLLGWLPLLLKPIGLALALGVNFGLWMWTSRILPNTDVGWRTLVPGAVFGAVGLEVLKFVGTFYVPRAVASSSSLFGTLGVLLAVIGWLFFFGRLVVYSAAVNAALHERNTERSSDSA